MRYIVTDITIPAIDNNYTICSGVGYRLAKIVDISIKYVSLSDDTNSITFDSKSITKIILTDSPALLKAYEGVVKKALDLGGFIKLKLIVDMDE